MKLVIFALFVVAAVISMSDAALYHGIGSYDEAGSPIVLINGQRFSAANTMIVRIGEGIQCVKCTIAPATSREQNPTYTCETANVAKVGGSIKYYPVC